MTQAPDCRQDSPEPVLRFRQRLTGVLLLTAIFFLNLLARFIWSPLLVDIEHDFALKHTQAGSLFLMISLGYFAGLLSSGHISARLGHHRTVLVSCLSCAAAVVGAMFAPSSLFLAGAMAVIGLTAGFYLPTGIALLTYRLAPGDFGKAFGCHEMAPSLAFITGPLLVEALRQTTGWRGVLIPVAAALVVVGVLHHRRPYSGEYRGEPLSAPNMRFVAAQRAYWLMLIPFIFGVGTNVGVFSVLPLYLIAERGMDQTLVNMLLSASRCGALFTVIIAGWTLTRISARTVVVVIFAGACLFTALLGVLPTRLLWLPIFVQPLFATAFFPAAFSILSQLFSPRYRNLATALITPVAMVVGAGLIPTMISAFGDAGRFHTGFVITGAAGIVCTAFLILIRLPEHAP